MSLFILACVLLGSAIALRILDQTRTGGDYELPTGFALIITLIIWIALLISSIAGPIDDRLFVKKFRQAEKTLQGMRQKDLNEKMNAIKTIQDLNADLIDRQYYAGNPWLKFASDTSVLSLKPIE